MSIAFSAALEASHIVRDEKGRFGGYLARLDATAPTADYYVQVFDSATLPAEGTGVAKMVVGPQKVSHSTGSNDYPFLELAEHERLAVEHGIVIVLSTTEFTKTIAGAYMSLTLAEHVS